MYILFDTDETGLDPLKRHVASFDDKPVLSSDSIEDYRPGGTFHGVDRLPVGLTRWEQLYLASQGVRVFSNSLTKESPLYAGPIPDPDKLRKVTVDGSFAEGRAKYFSDFGVNYIGRTNLNPRNIFLLDNKKGNPLHDPEQDSSLATLYAALPEDWWGSCGFVSTGNVDKLAVFFDEFPDVIPLAYTTGAFSKLKYMGREYVDAGLPTSDPSYGIRVRDAANRLSYKLSEPEEIEPPTSGWLQL